MWSAAIVVTRNTAFRILLFSISNHKLQYLQLVEFLLIMQVLLRPSLKWLNMLNISEHGGMFTWPHVFGEVEGHLQSKLSLIGASIGALHGACATHFDHLRSWSRKHRYNNQHLVHQKISNHQPKSIPSQQQTLKL